MNNTNKHGLFMSIIHSNIMPLLFLVLSFFFLVFFFPYQFFFVLLKFRHAMTSFELFPLKLFYDLVWDIDITNAAVVRAEGLNSFGVWLHNAYYAMSEVDKLLDRKLQYNLWQASKHFYYLSRPDFIFILCSLTIGTIWYRKHSEAEIFTTKHNMDSLILQEQELYPEIKLAYKHDLLDSTQVDDSWFFPLSETEFIKKHELLKEGKGDEFQQVDDFGNVFQRLDIDKTKNVFVQQLDRRFNGFHNLPVYRKFIFAMFGVMWNTNVSKDNGETLEINYKDSYLLNFGRRFNNKIMEANGVYSDNLIIDMFDEIRAEMQAEKDPKKRSQICKFDFTDFDDWCQQCYNQFSSLERYKKYVENRHAYELTAIASLLQGAYYFQGVFSHSLFQWLKSIDRPLYFVLACVGYQKSYFVEVAGILAHWEIEKNTGLPHITPKVNAAIEGLEDAYLNFKEEELGADGLQ